MDPSIPRLSPFDDNLAQSHGELPDETTETTQTNTGRTRKYTASIEKRKKTRNHKQKRRLVAALTVSSFRVYTHVSSVINQ